MASQSQHTARMCDLSPSTFTYSQQQRGSAETPSLAQEPPSTIICQQKSESACKLERTDISFVNAQINPMPLKGPPHLFQSRRIHPKYNWQAFPYQVPHWPQITPASTKFMHEGDEVLQLDKYPQFHVQKKWTTLTLQSWGGGTPTASKLWGQVAPTAPRLLHPWCIGICSNFTHRISRSCFNHSQELEPFDWAHADLGVW